MMLCNKIILSTNKQPENASEFKFFILKQLVLLFTSPHISPHSLNFLGYTYAINF